MKKIGEITLDGDAEKVYDAQVEALSTKMATAFKDFETEKLSEKEYSAKLTNILKDFDFTSLSKFKDLQDAVIAQGLELKGFRDITTPENLTVKAQMQKIIEDRKDEWSKMLDFKNHQGKASFSFDLNFKTAAGTMTMAGGYATPAAYLPQAAYEPGVIPIPRPMPIIAISMNYSGTNNAHIVFIEKITPGGTVVAVTENTIFQQVSFIFSAVSSSAKKYPGYIKISQEMLTDIDFVMAEIQNELKIVIDLAVDADALLGAGSGDNIKGIGTYAAAFSISIAGSTCKTTAPNNGDAIAATITQIRNSYFQPNAIFINPGDKTAMMMAKAATTGTYMLYPWLSADGKMFDGIPFIETPLVAVGSVLVCDTSKYKIREYIPFNVQIGWEGQDFIYDMVTIRGSRRLHSFMGSLETPAAVYDSLATIKTAITV